MSSEKRKEIERIYLGLTVPKEAAKCTSDYETFVSKIEKNTNALIEYIYENLKHSAYIDVKEPSFTFSIKKYNNNNLVRKHEVPIPKSSEEGHLLENIYVFDIVPFFTKNDYVNYFLQNTETFIKDESDLQRTYSFLIGLDQIDDYCEDNNFNLELVNKAFDEREKCITYECKVNVPICKREHSVQRKRK